MKAFILLGAVVLTITACASKSVVETNTVERSIASDALAKEILLVRTALAKKANLPELLSNPQFDENYLLGGLGYGRVDLAAMVMTEMYHKLQYPPFPRLTMEQALTFPSVCATYKAGKITVLCAANAIIFSRKYNRR